MQLLLSILLSICIFFLFLSPDLHPSYLSSSTISFSSLPTKTLRLHSFATKDPFQKLASDISPSVKHSLKPFSELTSANKSHNPRPLPFCKTRQLGVSGSLCGSSKGFPLRPWRGSVLSFCVRQSERGSKGDRVEATNLSAWPFHPLTHTLPLICCSPHACCLFTQLTRCCLMFSRSQTGPGGG